MSYKNSSICQRKSAARKATLIDIYRDLIAAKVPQGSQFYTLSGPIYNEAGKLGEQSELNQFVKSGIIREDQYHGIDYNAEIIKKNKKAAPKANFYHGDFYEELLKLSKNQNFKPAIIHADFINKIKKSAPTIGNIVHLLTKKDVKNVLLTINLPYNNPYSERVFEVKFEEIWKNLLTNQRFVLSYNEGWELAKNYYVYGGTGKRSRTTMLSMNLIRK